MADTRNELVCANKRIIIIQFLINILISNSRHIFLSKRLLGIIKNQ